MLVAGKRLTAFINVGKIQFTRITELILYTLFLFFHRMPLSMLKFARNDKPEISREGTSFYRSSFDESDTESFRDSVCDSTCDCSRDSQNLDSAPSDLITDVTLIHTTHVPKPSTTYFSVPRKTPFKKASMVITNVVDHIYSSVYTGGKGGKTVKHAKRESILKRKLKPTLAPKPDIVPMVDRKIQKIQDDKDGGYAPPYTGPVLPEKTGDKVRFSIPLYQNIVKYNKSDTLPTANTNQDNTTNVAGGTLPSGSSVKGQTNRSVDNWGYLVPGGGKYTGVHNDKDDNYL